MPTITIKCHGRLAELCPDRFTFKASSVLEALSSLTRQVSALRSTLGNKKHEVQIARFDTVESICTPLAEDQVIEMVPSFAGGKRGEFIHIAIGALLVATAFVDPAGIAGFALFENITIGSMLFGVGASLMIGGVIQLLSPTPKIDTAPFPQDPEASKYLGPPKNTTRIGTRIPIAYGRFKIYGHILSAQIDSKEVAV